mgnify:CR=1 FL=1
MHTGMLWFDNSQTALTVKIQKAVDYYRGVFGPSFEPDNLQPVAEGVLQRRRERVGRERVAAGLRHC